MQNYKDRIEHYLEDFLSIKNFNANLLEPIRYSVLKAGKRIRPILVYMTGEALGAALNILDAPAAAIELIHCYSLIHDDLPAMDNDDLRRGKPTCHRAFDEATAILAGDALQSLAFELLSDPIQNPVSPSQQIKMVQILAKASGIMGMVDGQSLDMAYSTNPTKADDDKNNKGQKQNISIEMLATIHQKKTGALIQAAVQLGGIAANCQDAKIMTSLQDYAENLGLAFQVQDDILDVEGKAPILGKNPGQDAALHKQTFTKLLGLESAKIYMQKLYQEAKKNLDTLKNIKNTNDVNNIHHHRMLELTDSLVQRQS